VEATDCGMEGTVNCDNREPRPARVGVPVVEGWVSGGVFGVFGVVIAGVAAVAEGAAAFLAGFGEADSALWAPAVLVDGRVPAAASALLVAEGFDGTAGPAGLDVETFFATGAACLASSVFLTAGLETGFALATGFFTVTGSFDELVRAQGLYPLKQAENVRSSVPKVTHRPGKDDAWRPEQARDCIEKSKGWARAPVPGVPCPGQRCPGSGRTGSQTRHCSSPCSRISRGRSMPMNTMRLLRFSSGPQAGPRSLPISWCTPWKITLRSVPCMCSTPL
jgi:hypothetical protein